MKVKQVIVIRHDLRMRLGKAAAQASHASSMFLLERVKNWMPSFTEPQLSWLNDGMMTKIVARVDSEEELLGIFHKAQEAGLESHLIQDSGKTEFGGVPTYTAVAIGPDKTEV